jgi:hypothetical protein
MKTICPECETDIRVYRREAMDHLDRAIRAEKSVYELLGIIEASKGAMLIAALHGETCTPEESAHGQRVIDTAKELVDKLLKEKD